MKQEKLSVFVGLIITNCIVMGRAAFAMQNTPGVSFRWFGKWSRYSLILIVVELSRVTGFWSTTWN